MDGVSLREGLGLELTLEPDGGAGASEHAATIKENETLLKYSGFDTYLELTSATFIKNCPI